jgi:ABC-2 type transport system permease protein
VFDPVFTMSAGSVLAGVAALPMAFLARFALEWALALVAFWTTRINAINRTYFALLMFFSGRVAPVALLPGVLPDLARALPFYYVVAFPVEVALGKLTVSELMVGYGMQALWLLIGLGVVSGVWRMALRRYSAVGG